MKKFLLLAVCLMIIAQLFVPINMMVQRFDTLKTGTEYKFKVWPVDPYDAFRGRYVSINVDTSNLYRNNYAVIKVGKDGFAEIEITTKERPKSGDYIKVKSKYSRLQLPFDRYYMDEKQAPKAEIAYRERATKDAYIKVKVKNGNAVIEGLYIDNQRIEDYVKTLE